MYEMGPVYVFKSFKMSLLHEKPPICIFACAVLCSVAQSCPTLCYLVD